MENENENKFEIQQLVLCSLFCIFILWVLLKVFINANIIENPLSINAPIKSTYQLNVNGNVPQFNDGCPFCCSNESGSLKFRATKPCNEIEVKQCNGLDKSWCDNNNDLCTWINNSCTYKERNPYKDIPCTRELNIGCAFAVDNYF